MSFFGCLFSCEFSNVTDLLSVTFNFKYTVNSSFVMFNLPVANVQTNFQRVKTRLLMLLFLLVQGKRFFFIFNRN